MRDTLSFMRSTRIVQNRAGVALKSEWISVDSGLGNEQAEENDFPRLIATTPAANAPHPRLKPG